MGVLEGGETKLAVLACTFELVPAVQRLSCSCGEPARLCGEERWSASRGLRASTRAPMTRDGEGEAFTHLRGLGRQRGVGSPILDVELVVLGAQRKVGHPEVGERASQRLIGCLQRLHECIHGIDVVLQADNVRLLPPYVVQGPYGQRKERGHHNEQCDNEGVHVQLVEVAETGLAGLVKVERKSEASCVRLGLIAKQRCAILDLS